MHPVLQKLKDFHGHLGPYVTVGYRMGLAANREFGDSAFKKKAIAYSGLKTPLSCMVDGIQVSSGCTLGKGNIKVEDMVGKKFFFRTVTFHILGEVTGFFGSVVQLKDASWIADSGRFNECIKNGTLNEVEPLGEWHVNTQTVTDFGPWRHQLPKEVK